MLFVLFAALLIFQNVKCEEMILDLLDDSIQIISPHRPPIFVSGPIEGQTATQFDGYSTWAKNSIFFPDLISEKFIFSAAFAIPTFPSENGIIFSMHAFEIIINEYGKLSITFYTIQSIEITVKVDQPAIPIHEWVQIQIAFEENDKSLILINGEPVKNFTIPRDEIQWPQTDNETEYYIGRHPDNEAELFDINAFNGVISEMTLVYNFTYLEDVIFLDSGIYNIQEMYNKPDFELPYDGDIHRPRLHAMPQRAWANEPHGFLLHNGTYHLFFQKNGNGPYWYMIKWGYLTSPDLIHWTEQPVILQPQVGADQKGIWSGHAVFGDAGEFDGVPTIFYTGVDGAKAGIFVATGSDDLSSWTKYGATPELGAKPIIPSRPQNEFPGDDFRDPFLFRFNDTWYMIVGTGINTDVGRMGSLFLYSSDDLYTFEWEFLGTMFTGNSSCMNFNVGQFWEMPLFLQLSPLDWLLLVNKTPTSQDFPRTLYWTGTFNGLKFVPYNLQPTDLELFINQLSPTIVYDDEGRLTAIGVAPDTWNSFFDDSIYHAGVGWANVFTFPKEWNFSEEGKLLRTPHLALLGLRKEKLVEVEGVEGDLVLVEGERQLEIVSTFSWSGTEVSNEDPLVGLVLFKSDTEQTKIYYNFELEQMVVDRRLSSTNENAVRDIQYQDYILYDEFQIKFHVFIDYSIIEVFLNDQDAFVVRTFPQSPESTQMELMVQGGGFADQVDVWKLDL